MKHIVCITLFATLTAFYIPTAFCDNDSAGNKANKAQTAAQEKEIDRILSQVEKRYQGAGFTADFTQATTLSAMKITDTAKGHAYFKRPGMMLWEYHQPDKYRIITDGETLWIYRPEDRQVTVGELPPFLGGGFLSDIYLIRKKFIVSLGESLDKDQIVLKLWPREKTIDVSVVHLTVSKKTWDVVMLTTYNVYGDETRIQLDNFDYDILIDDAMFKFKIPEGTDVIQLNP